MGTLRTPNANILRELPDRDREYTARGDRFAGSTDEQRYAAEVLGRAIGHAADEMATETAECLRALRDTLANGRAEWAETDADIAAAADVGRWYGYVGIAAAVRAAEMSFTPSHRLAIAAAACQLAGL